MFKDLVHDDHFMFKDLDLSIAIRRGIKKCTTQHPISNFISFDRLSPSHKALLCKLNPIDIPKTVQ